MLKSGRPTADELRSAITDALTAGVVTRDEILDMVSTDSPDIRSNGHAPAEPMSGADDLPIYTELPEGLIDLPSACEVFGKSRQLLFQWVTQGRLRERGLFKPPGRTVANVVVAKEDVEDCVNGTDGWPKRRIRTLGETPEGVIIGSDGLPVYTEVPEGLIDLRTAAAQYECTVQRFRAWIRRGNIKPLGRLKAGCPGGGYLVVDKEELRLRLESTPSKGGRPRKN